MSVKPKHISVPKSNKLFLLQSLDPQMTRLFHRRGQRGTQIFSTWMPPLPYTRLQAVSQSPLSQTTVHSPSPYYEDHVPRPTTTVLDLSRGRTAPIMEGKVESKLQAHFCTSSTPSPFAGSSTPLVRATHLSSILPLVSQSREGLWVPEVRHTIYCMESLGRF